jgi:hypothetical protein
MSRARELRTKKYADSPMNWPLLGTSAFFRAITSQNAMIKMTEIRACRKYLSNQGRPEKKAGRSKF